MGIQLQFRGDSSLLNLPDNWIFDGDPLLFGEQRTMTFQGTVPETPGKTKLNIVLYSPYRDRDIFIDKSIELEWKER